MNKFNRYEIPSSNIADIPNEYLNEISNDNTHSRPYLDRPLITQGTYKFNQENNEYIQNKISAKEKEYEKLINNLNQMSGISNNFFYILQGILGINCDTIFTDYSTTNVKESDTRLQKILEILIEKLKM
jgi:hypothetical protein